jgi:excinuclease ABC subunit B
MYEAAKNHEFELAAKYRDELQTLKQHSFIN